MYTYLPDLLAVQFSSFHHFLARDLIDVLDHSLDKLPTSLGVLRVDASEYKMTPPQHTSASAIQQVRTYGTALYIPARIHPTNDPTYHALASLPLLTDTSYFIVNGVRRVVVNQMVRCPNIYCKTKVLVNNLRTYTISFVSERGVWLRFERDKKGALWVRVNDFARLEITIFLRALGVTTRILEKTFPVSYVRGSIVISDLPDGCKISRGMALELISLMKGSKNKTHKEFRKDVEDMFTNVSLQRMGRAKKTTESTVGSGRRFLYDTMFGCRNYSFSSSGRQRINRRFGLHTRVFTLQPEDVLVGLHALYHLERGALQEDDIDHLKNRRIRLLQDILAEEIRRGMKRLKQEKGLYLTHLDGTREFFCENDRQPQAIRGSTSCPADTVTSPQLFHGYTMSTFGAAHVCDMIRHDDFLLPVPEAGGTRKVRVPLGDDGHFPLPGGTFHRVNRRPQPTSHIVHGATLSFQSKYLTRTLREFFGLNSLSQFMDQMNPLASITQKRRLTCLGPGGVSRQSGLDIRDIHPSHYGRICPIETPEGKNAGLVNSLASHASVSSDGSLQSHCLSTLPGSPNPAWVSLKAEHQLQRVFYPAPFRSLPTGVTAGWEASVEDTTGERWAAKDVRLKAVSPIAMISIATSLIPFLEHDDGNRALMASNMQRQAVPLLYVDRPIVGTGLERRVARDSRAVVVAPTSGQVIYTDGVTVMFRRLAQLQEEASTHKTLSTLTPYKVQTFALEPFYRSNHDTLIYQRPCVQKGDVVAKGTCLADTATTSHGELSLGRNALVAYMPWEGYNFEDAVVLNQRMVTENKFTSIHIEKYRTQTQIEDGHAEEFYRPPLASNRLTRNRSIRTDPYDWYGVIRPGTFVTQGTILVGKRRPEDGTPTAEERLLYDIFEVHRAPLLDCSLRVDHDLCGRIFDTYFFPHQNTYTQGAAEVHILLSRPIQIGDKIAGRHGNKGIISNILPPSDMPYLQDGTPLDILLNPLGVPSRMNVGQIFECLLGLAGTHLERVYRVRAFDEIYGPSASHLLVTSALHHAAHKCWWLNSAPFAFGKVRLFDGRTGILFEHPVTVGVAYILKLVHLVDKKIHARATGGYALITQQPLKGRSAGGGQRVGEMEVWALQGFSASYLLQELFTLKSDDCYGRHRATDAMTFKLPFPPSFAPESFRLLLSELRALCFDITYETSGLTRRKPPRAPFSRARLEPMVAPPIDVDPLPPTEGS
jgi:DNA-directed RNA polymerase beta subunit